MSDKTVLMKCGHIATADINNQPCCPICIPKKEALEIVENKPDLKDRKAKCLDCGEIVNSNWNLPFFEYRPEEEFDRFYSGCWGWE